MTGTLRKPEGTTAETLQKDEDNNSKHTVQNRIIKDLPLWKGIAKIKCIFFFNI